MKGVLLLLALGLAAISPLGAQDGTEEKPKTAVVNIQELFREYYKSAEAQAQINTERARIQMEDNELRQRVSVFDRKLNELNQRLRSEKMEEPQRKAAQREAGLLFQEREALEQLRRESIQERHLELNRRMMTRMQGILEEIRGIIAETSEKAGYDYVFDSEGLNSVQVPFLLYARDATDITAMMLKELNKNGAGK